MSPEMSKATSEALVKEAITKIREKHGELEFAGRYAGAGFKVKREAIEARIAELTQPLIDAMYLCERQGALLRQIREEINDAEGWRPNDPVSYTSLVDCIRHISTAMEDAK